jgi:hypothetical protein
MEITSFNSRVLAFLAVAVFWLVRCHVNSLYLSVVTEFPDMDVAQFKACVTCAATIDRAQVPSLSSNPNLITFLTLILGTKVPQSLILVSWGGVRLSPLGMSATNWHTVPVPDDRWWVWSNRWNKNWQGKPKCSEKTWTSATLSTTNSTWFDLVSNPGHLRYGATYRLYLLRFTVVFLSTSRKIPG